jgi:hypothetical protein
MLNVIGSLIAAAIVSVQFVATIMVILWVQGLARSMMIGRYRSNAQLLVVLVAVGLLTASVMSRFTSGVFAIAEQLQR